MVPGILKDVGDVNRIVSMIAPRRVAIVGGLSGAGTELSRDQLTEEFGPAIRDYTAGQAAAAIRFGQGDDFESMLSNP